MIDDMTDETRLTTGKFSLTKEKIDLNALINSVIENLAEILMKANCKIILHAPIEIAADLDPLRIEQVITNIISNASKYAEGSMINISLSVRENVVDVTIEDNGPGISEANHRGTRWNSHTFESSW